MVASSRRTRFSGERVGSLLLRLLLAHAPMVSTIERLEVRGQTN
jgi:hypothetical protein